MSPATTDGKRTVAEIDFNQAQASSAKIGNRSIHQFWHIFGAQFRGVLLAPQRRPESGKVSWVWREPADPGVFTGAELAEVRRRLLAGNRALSGGVVGDDDEPGGTRSIDSQVRASVSAMIGQLTGLADANLCAYLCRTETGPMLHSWGATVPAKPYVPDSQQGEVTGTVLVDGQRAGGITVLLENSAGQRQGRIKSDAGGSFRFQGVEPGDYRLRVPDRTDFATSGLAITMEREAITGLELRGGTDPEAAATSAAKKALAGGGRWWRYVVGGAALIAVVGGGVWYYRQRPATVNPETTEAANSWQAAKGELVKPREAESVLQVGPGEPGWSKLSARRADAKKTAWPTARNDVAREERKTAVLNLKAAGESDAPEIVASHPEPELAKPKEALAATEVKPPEATANKIRAEAVPADAILEEPKRAEKNETAREASTAGGTHAEETNASPLVVEGAGLAVQKIKPSATEDPASEAKALQERASEMAGKKRNEDQVDAGDPGHASQATTSRAHAQEKEEGSGLAERHGGAGPERNEGLKNQTGQPALETRGATALHGRSQSAVVSAEAVETVAVKRSQAVTQSSGVVQPEEAHARRREVRVAVTEWRREVLADAIVPTQPRLRQAGKRSDVAVLRAALLAEQQARMPQAFQAATVLCGVEVEIPAESAPQEVQWKQEAGASSVVGAVQGRRATLRWEGSPPPAGMGWRLVDGEGREIATVRTETSGGMNLKTTAGVRGWFWVAITSKSDAAEERMEWRLRSGMAIPAEWRREAPTVSGSVGSLTIPLETSGGSDVIYPLALVHSDTGWALTSRITVAVKQKGEMR